MLPLCLLLMTLGGGLRPSLEEAWSHCHVNKLKSLRGVLNAVECEEICQRTYPMAPKVQLQGIALQRCTKSCKIISETTTEKECTKPLPELRAGISHCHITFYEERPKKVFEN